MEKRTYYLSVGHLHLSHSRGSKAHLAVLAKKRVYLLSPHEEALWSVLSYKPLTYEDMNAEYKNLLHTLNMDDGTGIEECLRHLCELKLVIHGEGEYEIEAWYEAMQNVLILPSPEEPSASCSLPVGSQSGFPLITP